MGGPIKQGIMTGIREPYKHGGQAALVGNPVYPKTGGREHHMAAKVAQVAAPRIIPKVMPHIKRGLETFKNWFGKTVPVTRTVPRHGPPQNIPGGNIYSKGYPGGKITGKSIGPGSVEVTEQIFKPGGPLRYLQASPEGKAVKWLWDGKGWVAKAAAMPFKSPLVAVGLIYTGGKWVWPDGTPATKDEIKEIKKSGGDKDYGPHTKGKLTITQEQRDAKAKADKEKRINELLDTMGYDKARKNAAYDALIDAGRMVSERGSLRTKDIGRELIDPIVAATSARFDKPEQIREAVGLMKVKADIAQQMEDPQIKELRTKQMAIADKTIAGKGFQEVITDRITRGDEPTSSTLASILRATEGIDAKVIDTAKKPQGKDALDWVTEIVKKSHEEGTPHPAGTFVVSNRVLIIDEQGNITPYL